MYVGLYGPFTNLLFWGGCDMYFDYKVIDWYFGSTPPTHFGGAETMVKMYGHFEGYPLWELRNHSTPEVWHSL